MKVLALGAHPDDIEFGCGGSLIRFARAGHDVYSYVATCGELGGDCDTRRSEQEDAAVFAGIKKVYWGGYADCEVPLSRGLISNVESVLREIEPDFIFVHNENDTHQDHRNLAKATLSATRYVPNFLFYEGPTTLNFTPNAYIDVDPVLEDKYALLGKHESQVAKVIHGMPELSITDFARATARFRGIQGRKKNAEAFMSLRLFLGIPEFADGSE